MELTLQYEVVVRSFIEVKGRNPYFIAINSSILLMKSKTTTLYIVAILILLELTLQFENGVLCQQVEFCRNPYFIGINSAIRDHRKRGKLFKSRNPYYWN